MGRAQGQSHTQDQFATVMGMRRGLGADSDFTAASPSLGARRELAVLTEAVGRGDITTALSLLGIHCGRQAPLLTELRATLASQLVAEQYRDCTLSGADFVDLVASDGDADHVLLDADDNHTFHLWPDGMRYSLPMRTHTRGQSKTVCELVVNSRFERVPRGWWADRGTSNYGRCPACAAAAHQFPETAESHAASVFPAPQEPRFDELLRVRVTAGIEKWSAAKTHSDDPARARARARAIFRDTVRDHAFVRLQEGGSALLDRILPAVSHEGHTDFSGALALLTRSAWDELAGPTMPPVPRRAGVPSDRWFTVRDKRRETYARRLLNELRRIENSETDHPAS